MNIVRCKKGHFFDADQYSSCPHCGEKGIDNSSIYKEEQQEKKSIEKANRPDIIMGMMLPPEPVHRGNIVCEDKFISEDPIIREDNCKHKLVFINLRHDELVYKCEKCGHIAVFNRFKIQEFISKYYDCEISGACYTFPAKKRSKDIVSFSASFFDIGHENFDFDGEKITHYHTISPRDGGREFPEGYFDKNITALTVKQQKQISKFLKKIRFSSWISSAIGDQYLLMIGTSSYNTFSCTFLDGSKYRCIFESNSNKEFDSLYQFLTGLCGISPRTGEKLDGSEFGETTTL
jgi:hypothetical protein